MSLILQPPDTCDHMVTNVRVNVNKAWLKLMVLSVTRSKDLIVLSNQQ